MTIIQKLDEYLNEFKSLNTSEEIIQTVIFYGRQFKADNSIINEENRVAGCVSNTYLKVLNNNNKINIVATSDSLLSSGYLYILNDLLNEQPIQDIKDLNIEFIKPIIEILAKVNMTSSRNDAFSNIYNKILSDTKNL